MFRAHTPRLFMGAPTGLAGVLVLAGVALGQEARPGVQRLASVKHIMAGIHGPNAGGLNEALKGDGPKDDAAWAKVAAHAALLNESGHLLMQNNRCPDNVWAEAAAKLREGTAAVYEAAAKKDLKAAREGLAAVNASCSACHTKHKGAAPAPAAKPAAAAPAKPAAPAAPPAKPAVEAKPAAAPAPATPAAQPAAAAAPASAPAPAASAAPARVAAIKHLMAGINGPNCGALADLLKAEGPKDDAAWQNLVRHAALLNEVGFLLMEGGRCPDEVWRNACAALREHAGKVAEAGGAKNLEGARTGFKGVTAACGACHAVHKKPPT